MFQLQHPEPWGARQGGWGGGQQGGQAEQEWAGPDPVHRGGGLPGVETPGRDTFTNTALLFGVRGVSTSTSKKVYKRLKDRFDGKLE